MTELSVTDELGEVIAGTRPLLSHDEFLARYGEDFENYRRAMFKPVNDLSVSSNVARIVSRHQERDRFVRAFGFSIPCREAVEAVIAAGPVVEIGAGSGYWARLIAQHGGDIIATDSLERSYLGFEHGQHFPLERYAGKTAVRHYRDRNVFCSWPSLDETWFRQALKAMRIGRRLFYVAEDATADESAREYLDDFFDHEAVIDIPCFYGMHDRLLVYRKKRQGPWRERQAELQAEAAERRERLAAWHAETRERA